MKKARFGKVSYPLEKGDRILFYTDGIIEQKNPRGQMYTEARLRNIFRDLILRDDGDIVQGIYKDMKSFASKRAIDDDVTLLLLEF